MTKENIVFNELHKFARHNEKELTFVIGGKVIELHSDDILSLMDKIEYNKRNDVSFNYKLFQLDVFSVDGSKGLVKYIMTSSSFLNQLKECYKIEKGWI